MESPASNVDEPISPVDHIKSTQSLEDCLVTQLNALQNGGPPHLHGNLGDSHGNGAGTATVMSLTAANVLSVTSGKCFYGIITMAPMM